MTKTTPIRKCIIVLGMHRSGTSTMTRTLSLLGADLPKNLIPPMEGVNESGFWEPQKIADLHEQMLKEAGGRWDDWRSFDIGALPDDRQAFYRQEIRALINSEYGSSSLFVLKEPRISRFASLYIEALSALGIEPYFVHCNRNPLSVIASLAKRDGFTDAFAGLLWLRHELAAEYETRGFPRVFVSYESMMDGWQQQIGRIKNALGLEWPQPPDAAADEVDQYISPTQRHHTATHTDLLTHVSTIGWIKDAYSALKTMEQNPSEEEAVSTLNRIRLELDSGAQIFGAAAFPEFIEREKKLSEQLAGLRSEISRLEASEARAYNLYRLVEEQNKIVIEQNEAMRASTSWRITRPMRGLKRAVTEQGFARQCALNAGRLVCNRLKLYRMLDWPVVGPLIERAKTRLMRR